MADLLTTIKRDIDARIKELRPVVAEQERLTAAAKALGPPATRTRRRQRKTGPKRSAR